MAILDASLASEIVSVRLCGATQSLHDNRLIISGIINIVHIVGIENLYLLHRASFFAILTPFYAPSLIPTDDLYHEILFVVVHLSLLPKYELCVGVMPQQPVLPLPYSVALLDAEDSARCAICADGGKP